MKQVEKFFSSKPKQNLTFGVEVEMYLWDEDEERLLRDEGLMNEILDKLPQTVTRDYYTYQLEVRTKPHSDPESLIKEFIKTLKLCDNVFREYNIKVIPLSYFGNDEMFNGVHFHFRNGNNNNFEKMMFNLYPFVLVLTDCFKHSPSGNILSYRFRNSQHCSFPILNQMTRSQRYSDICMNRHTANNRHRMKKDYTMEIRTFDVPYNIEYFKNLTRLIYNIVKNINIKEKVMLDKNMIQIENMLRKTREDLMVNRTGYNFLFDMYNYRIYFYLCDKFKIKRLRVPFTFFEDDNNDKLRIKFKKVNEFLMTKEEKEIVKTKRKRKEKKKGLYDITGIDRNPDITPILGPSDDNLPDGEMM